MFKFKSLFSEILFVLGILALIIILAFVAWHWRQYKRDRMRHIALPVTIKNGEQLERAIKSYDLKNGSPPEKLSLLLPQYIQKIPGAGAAAKDGWHYKIHSDGKFGGWELYIKVRDEYSPNWLGFGDAFVFHPNGEYSQKGYGGVLMTFADGKWGYYVE
jgi:hypothetical protein